MTKSIRRRTGFIPGGDICTATGKKSWLSKADAKAMARRTPHSRGLSAYRCSEHPEHWHLGHLPRPVIAGTIDRSEIYPPRNGRC